MIKLEHVSKAYKLGNETIKALDDVKLEVKEGEFISIMGPSGSGKSTLMNIIGLLDVCDEGKYILDGTSIKNLNDKALSKLRSESIGFVFQNFNLLTKLSALENVMVPLLYQGYSNEEAISLSKEALSKLGLSHRYKHLPTQLSGGQMQRVAIARAIVTKPKILLADEPTGAVDSKTGEEIMKIFKELNDSGQTIILITHDINVAKKAKGIYRIKDGKISKWEAKDENK